MLVALDNKAVTQNKARYSSILKVAFQHESRRCNIDPDTATFTLLVHRQQEQRLCTIVPCIGAIQDLTLTRLTVMGCCQSWPCSPIVVKVCLSSYIATMDWKL